MTFLHGFGDVWGYYVCSQHLHGVFPLGGDGTSSVDGTYDNGVNREAWVFR